MLGRRRGGLPALACIPTLYLRVSLIIVNENGFLM